MAEAENNIERPVLADPVAQDNKLVGDEEVQEVREVPVEVNTDPVPAQVAPPREADSDTVNVHETSIALDEVITDPNSPKAVQIPDAGRGSLDLPAHRLAAQTPEAVFEAHASEAQEVSDDDRKAAVAQGQSVGQAETPAEPQKAAPSSDDDNS